MGKIIMFPNKGDYIEKVEGTDIETFNSIKYKDIDNNVFVSSRRVRRKRKNISINLLITLVKSRNIQMLILIIFTALLINNVKSLAFIGANKKVGSNIESSASEDFNHGMESELNNSLPKEVKPTENSTVEAIEEEKVIEDIFITITPTVKGEVYPLYNTTINITLNAKDIKEKDNEKSFKFKDVVIDVTEVNADLTDEELAILQEDIIEEIAKESVKLTKKIEKELGNKDYKEYITKLINQELNK